MPGVIAMILKSFPSFPGYARRTVDVASTPYLARACHAFIALGLLGLPLLLIAFAIVIQRSRGQAGKRILLFVVSWSVLIAAGASIAATDAKNERGWNPALYGAPFAAAAFPAALAAGLLRDDERRTGAVLCAAIAAFPVTLLIAAVGPIFVEWGLHRGWPIGW